MNTASLTAGNENLPLASPSPIITIQCKCTQYPLLAKTSPSLVLVIHDNLLFIKIEEMSAKDCFIPPFLEFI